MLAEHTMVLVNLYEVWTHIWMQVLADHRLIFLRSD